ncbi:geobacillin-26 family protein [Lysinibacillus sp. FSL H8-0500]|uniref:geobacillin-26 family protein n=1 Tax=Lysinibacillus sp. FSL H8-0500 TaxID=2921393 RepID=UPI0031014E8E
MKFITKLVAFFALCFFTVVLPMGTVQAAEEVSTQTITFEDGTTANILVDNASTRVVEAKDDSNIYIATNDKQTNNITIETYDLERNLLSTEVLDGNQIPTEENDYNLDNLPFEEIQISEEDILFENVMPLAAQSNYKLLQTVNLQEAYGYWIYSTNQGEIWMIKLRTGEMKSTFYKGDNKTHFNDFKRSVDNFMASKNQLVAKVGTGILTTIATLYLVPEPVWTKIVATLITIVGAAIAYAECKAMFDAYSDSRLYYSRVVQ